jgi:uncharacterized protein (TIGR02246 family)
VSIEEQILVLRDEQAIRDLIRGAWAAIDRKEWDVYADAFAEDGTFEIWGQRRQGREAIADGPARDLAKFDRLQHIITNEIVRVTGDDADGQWYAIAVHVPDEADLATHADVGLRYRFSAHRGEEGWRLSEVVLKPVWTAGMKFEIDDPPAAT